MFTRSTPSARHVALQCSMIATLFSVATACSLQPLAAGVAQDSEPGSSETSVETHRGVIAIQIYGQHQCTGVLIGPYHALTAAHCTDQAHTGQAEGTMRRTLSYFDPEAGPRAITREMETLVVHVVPAWSGLQRPEDWDGADLEADLAVVERVNSDGITPLPWSGTSSDDYMPIWLGSIHDVGNNRLYGGGIDAKNVGQLSSMNIDIAGSEEHFFWDLGHTHRVCKGDSGGPYLDTVGEYGEVVLGIAIAGQGVTRTSPCTRSGGKQFGARLNSRFSWINQQTGDMCTRTGSIAQCF